MKRYKQIKRGKISPFPKSVLRFFAANGLCFLLIIVPLSTTHAQLPTPTPTPTPNSTSGAISTNKGTPVVLGGEELFNIRAGVGAFSAEDRAQAVSNRLLAIAKDPTIQVEKIAIDDKQQTTNLTVGDRLLLTIIDADAAAADQPRQVLARTYVEKIQNAITQYRIERNPAYLRQGGIKTIIATVALIATLILFGLLFPRLYTQVNALEGTRIPALRIQNYELLPATRISRLLISLLKLLRLILTLGTFAVYIPFVLSFFPWTRQFGRQMFGYFLQTAETFWKAFLNYLPSIFALAIIIFITYYVIRLLRSFFTALGNGTLTVQGFYPDWAEPSYKLSVILFVVLATVIAFPYLPGFGSPAFQGISLFLGLLFSLGSSVLVSNIVAGIVLIYTRAFQIGDRIRIGDTTGDVVEKSLFVSRIRTIKNVIITIPNSSVFTSQITNFSAAESDPNKPALILHTTVTLGYDLPWRLVHNVLIDAAKATEHILPEPEPFVLQTSLDDFYVSYEINAYTKRPGIMARIYSELHQNIQDKCNEASIEILSPHYSALRDGNQNTIPESYLPKDYTAPGFRFSPLDNIINPPNDQSDNSPQQQPTKGFE